MGIVVLRMLPSTGSGCGALANIHDKTPRPAKLKPLPERPEFTKDSRRQKADAMHHYFPIFYQQSQIQHNDFVTLKEKWPTR
jgi:hypothetical protein